MNVPNPSSAAPSPSEAATVQELCTHLERSESEESDLLCAFARRFLDDLPRPLLQERSLSQLSALVSGAFRFLREIPPAGIKVELVDPDEEGWAAPITVVRAAVGDRPFVVDTLREYLAGEGLAIQEYVYPVFRVRRDDDGRLAEILDPTDDREGSRMEALVHAEIPPILDPARREALEAGVRERLDDVVAATEDFRSMLDAVDHTVERVEAYAGRFPERAEEYREVVDFLRWLRRDNFVFLGYRAYDILDSDEGAKVRVEPGSGLGILRDTSSSAYAVPVPFSDLPAEFRARVTSGPLLVVSKANRESPVHRRARMDYVGVKKLDEEGHVVGERRFLGLLTSQAYAAGAGEIPILRHKLQHILDESGARPGSHDYKEIVTILNAMPKEELFEATVGELESEVETVLTSLFSEGVRVTVRPDPLRGEVAVMVILPGGKFSAEVRKRIGRMLARRFEGDVRTYYLAMSAADQARLHFYLTTPHTITARSADPREIEREILSLLRSWDDRLVEHLAESAGADEARHLARVYGAAMNDEYRAANSPAAAVHDIVHMERMRRQGRRIALQLRRPLDDENVPASATVLKLYMQNERLVLSDFMPILEDAGVRVLEVDTFALEGSELPAVMLYSFLVQTREAEPIPADVSERLAEALLASHGWDAPRDPYNGLVLRAGLAWREVDVLRTYANYASQIGAVPSRLAPVRALMAYPRVARLLIDLFAQRLDPSLPGGAEAEAERDRLRDELSHELEQVVSLADDRALRRLRNLVEATVRTNYFRHGGARPTATSGGSPYISIKIDCGRVEELKKLGLLYEVYVHSARMEGVHLRAAPVSRGGIRWSDRHDDFRTEILGLTLTQVVKNATIVPSGSKGGFITKRSHADREAMMEEAAEQYRTLIRGLLDVTDNLRGGEVVPPPGVVRLDGDDPYLVVAADKGTAHLSDVANAVAAEYDFWLGDAFASGGSQGYDHKKEGITARGAWECVKRHFREMGKDIQTTPFTVAGVGDMSGDVFGNGMLLSRQIRLVAAFDHRHVFIDPDPDPATSYAERERLFALARSSWDDYDRSLLSAGGMIVPRASKEVQITPEARRALGLGDDVEALDGEALVRAVLCAPVELLWNGGIGTYVKEREETHAEAGDTANDPVRVNASELRCRVVGEGGNLGFTQRARVRFALNGGRINTDALDNSAGVDMSDHEVNLKILLDGAVRDGSLPVPERNRLLEGMTDEVSRLVLHNNIGQSLAVSLDERRSREALDDFASLISMLEQRRRISREADAIPGADELRERAAGGVGLSRPVLCVLLAHAKLDLKRHLLDSRVLDDPVTDGYLEGYFPRAAVEAIGSDRVRSHQLRREIVATEAVNDLANLMGSVFVHRLARDTGTEPADVVRAWLVAAFVSGTPEIRRDLERLEGLYASDTVYRWLLGLARVLESTTHWILHHSGPDGSSRILADRIRTGLSTLRTSFAKVVAGEDRTLFLARLGELQDVGVERSLGERLITLRFLPQLLEVVSLAEEVGTEVLPTARAYYAVSERFGAAKLRERLRDAARGDDPWEKRLAQALTEDVWRAQRELVRTVLARAADDGLDAALAAVERDRPRELRAFRDLSGEIAADGAPLAAHALAVRMLAAIAGR